MHKVVSRRRFFTTFLRRRMQSLPRANKPYPGQILATVLGRTRVGPANLWTCQLSLVDAASKADPTAQRIFADLLGLAIDDRR
jgi:hypothetical protein